MPATGIFRKGGWELNLKRLVIKWMGHKGAVKVQVSQLVQSFRRDISTSKFIPVSEKRDQALGGQTRRKERMLFTHIIGLQIHLGHTYNHSPIDRIPSPMGILLLVSKAFSWKLML